MRRGCDAKNDPRDYGIARNFKSGVRDRRTLLGTLYGRKKERSVGGTETLRKPSHHPLEGTNIVVLMPNE